MSDEDRYKLNFKLNILAKTLDSNYKKSNT